MDDTEYNVLKTAEYLLQREWVSSQGPQLRALCSTAHYACIKLMYMYEIACEFRNYDCSSPGGSDPHI